jgi:hypothetical protein
VGGNTTITGNITAANANVTSNLELSGGTANGVAYLNTSKQVTTGSALVFDGTNLGVGVTPSAWGSNRTAIQLGGSSGSNFVGGATTALKANNYFGTTDTYIANGYANAYVMNSGAHLWLNAPSGTANAAITTFTQAMTLDASGNLGIGTTSPGNKLVVNGSTGSTQIQLADSTASNNLILGVNASTVDIKGVNGFPMAFYTGNTERARIDTSGNLLVVSSIFGNGCTTTTANLPSNAGVNSINNGSTVAFNFGIPTTTTNSNLGNFFNGNGAVGSITVNGLATSYNTLSDYRLKNITGPLTGAKDFIMALKPKQGTWKADGSAFVGFLAHEFQEVSPSSVSGEKDAVDVDGKPIMQAMQASSSEVMANLVAFIQEQQALITSLTDRIAALEAK